MGKKSERKYINAYIKLNHFDGHLELTQLVNQSYYNFKWKKWKRKKMMQVSRRNSTFFYLYK